MIWTGDSARHDNDEKIPRTEEQVEGLNELLVAKFVEVFGKDEYINDTDPTNDFIIPIVPTFGNNDILPHNILAKGPNRWTKRYTSIWNKFIPEEQRHGFERGGWFYVEVIPNNLAVFSLNTMYFFDSNSAVDGCADRSEPGYEQMEWLRIQLQFLRERGMKAIMMGHVPPARTESKRSWDETCWQKYTLWMRQYRDIVVGSMYGHMNIDHFLFQDAEDLDLKIMDGLADEAGLREALGDKLTIQSSADYLTDLRADWSDLPNPPSSEISWTDEQELVHQARRNKRKKKDRGHRKYLKKIGGVWAERYSASLVSPSVIPKYFPTLRVIEYNISGLEHDITRHSPVVTGVETRPADSNGLNRPGNGDGSLMEIEQREKSTISKHKKKRKKNRKHKRPKKPNFEVPAPPSKTAAPGPAYSPQTLTWLGFTQYYANLTKFAGYYEPKILTDQSMGHGKHPDKKKPQWHPNHFEFEVEYDTRNDSVYRLQDLTMRGLLDVATRIGEFKPKKGDRLEREQGGGDEEIEWATSRAEEDEHIEKDPIRNQKKHKGGRDKHRKHKKRKAINKVWFTFVKRAYVSSMDDTDLHDEFGQEDAFSDEGPNER